MVTIISDPMEIPATLEGARDVSALDADIANRNDRAAVFLRSLSEDGRDLYCRILGQPQPPAPLPPVPDILTSDLADIETWLFRIWEEVEQDAGDEDAPALPFADWLDVAREDAFYRHHLHARFYLAETEPELPLWE